MTFKTILVHVQPHEGDDPHVRAAASLASLFGAELAGVGAASHPYRNISLSHVEGPALQAVIEELEGDIRTAEAMFRDVAGGLATSWRSSLSRPAEALAAQALRGDLIVAAQLPPAPDSDRTPDPADLLMETSLPVLVTPHGADRVDAGRIVVGWKNTHETRRAVTDALPFLSRASRVVLAAVDEGADEQTGLELEALADRLRHHGANPEIRRLITREEPSAALLELCDDEGAGLLVVGAYGRPRARQWLLGGVTSRLLRHAWRPVFYSR